MDSQWAASYSKFLRGEQWRIVRARALNYYGHRCQCCRTMRGKIQVHHLSYFNYRNPPLRDLTVLCEDCHKEVTKITRARKFKGIAAVAYHKMICKKRKK